MGREILSVSEERLDEVIAVIRAGLREVTVSERTRDLLETWCEEESAYLRRLRGEES